MPRINNIDTLSYDILDKDFVKIFQPIHLIQALLGFRRVHIQYKFVTEPTPLYQIYSCFVQSMGILMTIYATIHCETILRSSLVTILFLYFGVIFNQFCGIVVAWRNNFLHGKLNSQLYVKLQEIDRSLIFKKNNLNKTLSKRTLIITVVIFTLSVLWIVSFGYFIPTNFCPAIDASLLLSMGIYTEIILSIIFMYYIAIRVEYLNSILAKVANRTERMSKIYENIWILGDSNHSNVKVSDKLVRNLHCVLNALADWIELYQFAIFCFMTYVLVTDLIVMQSLVTGLKGQMGDYRATLYLSPMFLFTIVQIILCFLASAVTSKLEQTRKLCNSIIHSEEKGNVRNNAKRMVMLLDAKRDMSVYGVFSLSTSLPLSLIGIVASYTIVLFQFALL